MTRIPFARRPARALAGCAAIIVSAALAALAGCDTLPRDTSATPAPPRLPITPGDEVNPGPTSMRNPRAPAASTQ